MLDGLDWIELSALWYHLPCWEDIGRRLWLYQIKERVNKLFYDEKIGCISMDELRSSVYNNDELSYYFDIAVNICEIKSIAMILEIFELAKDPIQVELVQVMIKLFIYIKIILYIYCFYYFILGYKSIII